MTPGVTLLVDIGNSRVKWARVDGLRLLDPGEALHIESPAAALRAMVEAQPKGITRLLTANVGGDALGSALTEVARDNWGIAPEFVTPARERHGVRCGYSDPSRLGSDRWVALVAVRQSTRGAACVIDAGTTVTLDALDGEGQHLGGLIMAGPRIICAALHRETSGIGETSGTPRAPTGVGVLGTNTEDAVANGAMLSVAGALDRALAAVSAGIGEQPTVYITGGDARVLSPWLETRTRNRANLVLEGLAFIAAEG